MTVVQPDLAAAVARADERRLALRERLAARHVDLPLRYWRQQAHFTTPAEEASRARRVEGGTAPDGADPRALRGGARRAGGPPRRRRRRSWRGCSREPRRSPMVMLDAEDALAVTDEAAERGRADAIERARRRRLERRRPAAALRFYRPPGLNLETTARELYAPAVGARGTLRAGRDAARRHRVPQDRAPRGGRPGPRHAHRGRACAGHARRRRSGRRTSSSRAGPPRSWPTIALRAADRLCALVFGLADYSADLGLPSIANDHPLADWARAEIVNVAGAVGVPAIDGMTLDYPVADPALDAAANRERFLERMALGPRRRCPRARLGHARQVGRPSRAAVRGAPGVRGGVQPEAARGGGGQARVVRRRGPRARARARR